MEKEMREKVMLALGEASMCWDPIPTGEFRSEKALEIGENLLAYIEATRKLDAEFK